MSIADLKVMVNSKLPGQEGFKPINEMIEDIKLNTEAIVPSISFKGRSIDSFLTPPDINRRFTGLELQNNQNKDIVLLDINSKGLWVAPNFDTNISFTYDMTKFGAISGYMELDLGYTKIKTNFLNGQSNNDICGRISIFCPNQSDSSTYNFGFHRYHAGQAGEHSVVSFPYALYVERLRVIMRYSVSRSNPNQSSVDNSQVATASVSRIGNIIKRGE